MKAGTFKYSVAKLKAAFSKVNASNVAAFERAIEAKGEFFTLDARPYVEMFDDLHVFYRFEPA